MSKLSYYKAAKGLQAELHTRQEIERLADELDCRITYDKYNNYLLQKYDSFGHLGCWMGPYTLTELHAKLLELKGEKE